MANTPPYRTTEMMCCLVDEIAALLDRFETDKLRLMTEDTKRECLLRSMQASLAIEQNSLSLTELTELFESGATDGPAKDILEAKNAIEVYKKFKHFDPLNISDLLQAHRMLMDNLVSGNGCFRPGNVGVFAGTELIHVAPPAKYVPQLVRELFDWYEASEEHPLIKAAVFHFEFEFIHPFSDGNGRMGRLWHALLLSRWNESTRWLAVEELIKNKQDEYYRQLNEAGKMGESTHFILFMLQLYRQAIEKVCAN